jgi:hypothetical protein
MAKHRRGRTAASKPAKADAAVDRLPLSLPDVYLLTAHSAGQEAVGGLTLTIDQDGLTVIAPHGTTAAQLTWSELTLLETVGHTRAPGGEEAVALEATGPVRTHRFIVPTEDPVALEATIAAITGDTRPDRPRNARPDRPKKKRKRK